MARKPHSSLDWHTFGGRLVRSFWSSFIFLFLLSFVLRLNQLNRIPTGALIPSANRELGAIAISLMETGRFANPYILPTGPTAHLPPLYPFILSLIYRWFGLTPAAGYVSLLLIALAASLLFAMLPWFSQQLGLGWPAGFIGGLAGALLVESEWPGHGEYLTGIILGLLLVAFLRRWNGYPVSWTGSLFLGLAMGAAFHLQPALLPVTLACMAFEVCWSRSQRKWISLAVLSLGIVLACIPWTWRNYAAFNSLFFIRSNIGLELRMGNQDGSAALMESMHRQNLRHPTLLVAEARHLNEVGEAQYMREAQQEALDWIWAHPGDFLWLTLQRIANLWLGPLDGSKATSRVFLLTFLAFWGVWQAFSGLSIPQRAALIIPLATYPVIYYFVAYMPRYRLPIDWILFILAGAAVWSWIRPRYAKDGFFHPINP